MSITSAPPPGLDKDLVCLFAGGNANWRRLTPFKRFTNAFICDTKRGLILLGLKKRGFGKDLYNGFGGKIEPHELPLEAAIRELKEEAGVTAELRQCGILLFVNASAEYSHCVHIFKAEGLDDEPIETDEMRPQWFSIPLEYQSEGVASPASVPDIPYDRMWPDDKLWMPLLLKGQEFYGRVDFGRVDTEEKEGSWTMERWWFGTRRIEPQYS